MMKKQLVVWFLCFGGITFAQNEQLFKKANALYNEGKYEKAATTYLQILDSGVHSVSLYYNLGNTYYKLNQVAPSIYYYEKALWLSPNDADVRNNLLFAQNMTVDAIEALPATFVSRLLENSAGKLSYNRWAACAVAGMFLFMLSFMSYYFSVRQNRKRLFFGLSLGFLSLSVLFVAFSYHQHQVEKNENPAIIFAKETSVRSEPNYRSEGVFLLHEGAKVNVKDALGNWKKIALSDGKIGWIPVNDLREVKK